MGRSRLDARGITLALLVVAAITMSIAIWLFVYAWSVIV